MVARMPAWVTGVSTWDPGVTPSPTIRVAMWPPLAWPQHSAFEVPSSQVTITTPPSRYHGVIWTWPSRSRSQLSAVDNGQSWPSSHMFGVTHTKAGADAAPRAAPRSPKGWTLLHGAGSATRWRTYMNGLCFLA